MIYEIKTCPLEIPEEQHKSVHTFATLRNLKCQLTVSYIVIFLPFKVIRDKGQREPSRSLESNEKKTSIKQVQNGE